MSSEGGLFLKRELSEAEQQKFAAEMEAGHSAFDAENYSDALEHYHRASVIDSSEPEVWSCLGLTLTNLDFDREAWRSHKLAIVADPDRPDALWYAAEFLVNVEDYELASFLLERYVQLETDKERLEEGRSLLEECRGHISEHQHELRLEAAAKEDEEAEDDEEEDDMEGFGYEDDEGDAELDEDEDDVDDGTDEDAEAEGELSFVADMAVQLTGMGAKCSNCGMALPLDAPYCFNCRAMHFYGD
jgi:tetratricopeptide (TPR) repeat protein